MSIVRVQYVLASMLLAGLVGLGVPAAEAALGNVAVDKCLAGKLKRAGKGAAAYLNCHSKGAAKSSTPDPACLDKASDKLVSGFTKLDDKGGCAIPGDGPARDADADSYAASVGAAVGHVGKCDSNKDKHVGKYVAARLQCYAKAAGKTGNVDPTCITKAVDKLNTNLATAEAKPPCSSFGQAGTLLAGASDFADSQACELDAGNPECIPTPTPTPTVTPTVTATPGVCGDGTTSPDEPCDASAPSTEWTCGPSFPCVACNCACPTRLHFGGDAAYPDTRLDLGWHGIAHRMPFVSGGDVTLALAACSGGPARPCGVCAVSGPVANTGAGEVANQRCSGDLSVQCSSAPNGPAGCGGPLGLCQFYLGPPLSIVGGGVGTCFVSEIAGSASGTADVEGGAIEVSTPLSLRVYAGIGLDAPCPRCNGDAVSNDGVQGGTCSHGPRVGLACDGNGSTDQRPDFGTTSLDCPPGGVAIATLPIALTQTTGTVTRTVASTSPNCSGDVTKKCLCDTCNSSDEQPCDSNADCPVSGGNPGICGGRRCLGGSNDGGPCGGSGGGASACPAGGSCGRPGEPTKPNGCVENCAIPGDGTLCTDTAPLGDNEGQCPHGPPTGLCSLASGHPQRSCTTSNQCCDDPPACALDPAVPGDCEITTRRCFLDNGLNGSIVAVGMADAPQQDTSQPVLGAVFCVGPTTSPAVNAAVSLPGPGRLVAEHAATALP